MTATDTTPVRYYSEACFLDRPWECTGVANPDAPHETPESLPRSCPCGDLVMQSHTSFCP